MELTHHLGQIGARAADNALDEGARVLSAGMVDVDLSLVFMLGLFLVFAVLLHFIVLKPLIAAQEARQKGMGGAREDASALELKAAEAKLDYERRLGKARQDAVVIREALKQEASATAAATTAAVQADTDKKVLLAKGELVKFGDKARSEMKSHADQLSNDLATKLLGGNA
ncbi:MAG: ATP synthase F0 subunit B [Deltaproteobacteria bacterium]|nr:ATP synthase F0 subunit B [Deltaproteobacteria bacterium]